MGVLIDIASVLVLLAVFTYVVVEIIKSVKKKK